MMTTYDEIRQQTRKLLRQNIPSVDEYKKAIKLDPKRAIYYSHLAQTYKKMDLEKEAAQAEEKANQLQNNPSKRK